MSAQRIRELLDNYQPGNAAQLVAAFYEHLWDELKDGNYTSAEQAMFDDAHLYYGRYLQSHTRNYFEQTVFPPIAAGIVSLSESPGVLLRAATVSRPPSAHD